MEGFAKEFFTLYGPMAIGWLVGAWAMRGWLAEKEARLKDQKEWSEKSIVAQSAATETLGNLTRVLEAKT